MIFPPDRPPIMADIWLIASDLTTVEAHHVLDLARRMHRRRGGLNWEDIDQIAERQRRKRPSRPANPRR